MISHNPYSNCANARLYYYDFLSERTRAGIPETALYHINECGDCQAEIERLETLLVRAKEDAGGEQRRRDSAVSTLLKLHFAHAEEPVTCSMVKPFLASLADPVLELRVPTPITMHVDKCRACSNDLRVLRDLQLTHKQLCHLGQLLADEPTEDTRMCSKARTAIPAVVSMVLRETNAETLKHLCICPDCRKHFYRRREAVRQKLLRGGTAQGKFLCEGVSARDIYDYALPYGIDPANDQHAESRSGLASHLGDCPSCLARVQELHRTIGDIAERADSDVVTVYHLDESTRDEGRATSDERRTTVDFAASLKRKIAGLKAKPLIGTGFAAAAIILLCLSLFLYSPGAAAVTIDQIYGAVEKVTNVYIATFAGDGPEPQQELWVSQRLNTYLTKTGPLWVVSDVGAGIAKSKDALTGAMGEEQLAQDEIGRIKMRMNISLALMPFHNIYGIPRDAQWTRVVEDTMRSTSSGTEVYDLTWTESTVSGIRFNRFRFLVDPITKLPHRVEMYQKRSTDGQYSLTSVKQVKYMSDADMEQVIREASF